MLNDKEAIAREIDKYQEAHGDNRNVQASQGTKWNY